MIGYSHKIGGLCVGLVSAHYSMQIPIISQSIGYSTYFIAPVCAIVGALMPDIDTEYSTISLILKPVSKFLRKFVEHRKETHCLIVPILLALITFCLARFYTSSLVPAYAVGTFTIGYLMHLVQDGFTKGGTPWIYPIKNWRFSLLEMNTGSKFEPIVTAGITFVYAEIVNYIIYGDYIRLFAY